MAQNYPGYLITLEGGEGSGKSSAQEVIENYLISRKFHTLTLREPGGTEIGDEIRHILKNPGHYNMDPIAELLLFNAARAQIINEKIMPAIEAGGVVLLDRFFDSTFAYQGHARGIPMETVSKVVQIATGGLMPDLTIYFDVDPEVGLARKGEERGIDRLDAENLEFHRKVREGYHSLIESQKDSGRWEIIDANQPQDEVIAKALAIVENRLIEIKG